MRIRGYDEETEQYTGGVEELSGDIADLTKSAEENHVAIQHFPVYKTNAAEIDEEKMQALTHPLIWNFYSGKAVKAMLRFVQKNDAVNLFGASAKKAFEENF